MNERRRLVELASAGGDLAAELGLSPRDLERWQRTGRGLKRYWVRAIRDLAAAEERHVALQQSGLPVCSWVEGFAGSEARSPEGHLRAIRELRKHAKGCSVCLHRERFLEQRFGRTESRFGTVYLAAEDLVQRFPSALAPIPIGALSVCFLVVVQALLSIPALIGAGDVTSLLAELGLAFLGGAGSGACGGVAYVLTKPIADVFGDAAPYVLGMASFAAGLGGALLLGPYVASEAFFPMPEGYSIWLFLVVSIVGGFALGHTFTDTYDYK